MANPNMSWEERLPMQLRSLYRSYGYQIYKMSDFETYDLYRENKNFWENRPDKRGFPTHTYV